MKLRYNPFSSISCPWRPRCTMRPASKTSIWSAVATVFKRCAMEMTVLPAVSRDRAAMRSCSFSGSTELVASSRMTMGASLRIARAMEIL